MLTCFDVGDILCFVKKKQPFLTLQCRVIAS